eukprot:3691526-Amphidinium_carterae.1
MDPGNWSPDEHMLFLSHHKVVRSSKPAPRIYHPRPTSKGTNDWQTWKKCYTHRDLGTGGCSITQTGGATEALSESIGFGPIFVQTSTSHYRLLKQNKANATLQLLVVHACVQEEAGTEAALMRTELALMTAQDPNSMFHNFQVSCASAF